MPATEALYGLLTDICTNNDHSMALTVLQFLGKIRRGGYMSLMDYTYCLIYCANKFADNDNGNFFQEFVQYMPDINRITGPGNMFFSVKCKAYYYTYKHTERLLYKLKNQCNRLDILTLDSFLKHFLINNHITDDWQLIPLFQSTSNELNNDGLKVLCNNYRVPIKMVSGKSADYDFQKNMPL